MGQPTEAVQALLRSYPEPWKVVCISHPQTILTDLRGRDDVGTGPLPSGRRTGGARTPAKPEARILRQLGAKGRLA